MPIDKWFGRPNNVSMKTIEAIDFFGSKAAVAAALGLKTPSIYEWGEFPPQLRQIQLEMLSGGQLKADAACLPQARPVPVAEQGAS
jgi:hypothetical protein